MAPRVVRTLSDLHGRWGGHIRLECVPCRRVRLFAVSEVHAHFRKMRWNDEWRELRRRFYCAVCLGRPDRPQWIEQADRQQPGEARACFAPYGINARTWALAGPADRERLIKARR